MWIALWAVTVVLAIWQLVLTIWVGRLFTTRPDPRELVNLQIVFNNLIAEFQETADERIAELDRRLHLLRRESRPLLRRDELVGPARLLDQWRRQGRSLAGLDGALSAPAARGNPEGNGGDGAFDGRASGVHPALGGESLAMAGEGLVSCGARKEAFRG